jgi:hypothetical protein
MGPDQAIKDSQGGAIGGEEVGNTPRKTSDHQ